LTKKEAYIVVRHIKYGPAKKGAKKSKDAEQSDAKAVEGDVEPLTTNTSDSEFPFSPNRPEKSINNGNDPESLPVLENRYTKVNHRVENKVQPTAQVPPAVVENRYIKAEPRNRFQQSNAQVPPAVVENRYIKAEPRNRFQQPTPNTGPSPGPVPGTRDSNRWSPPNSNQPRHVPVSNTGPGPGPGPGPRDANRWTPPNLNQPRHAPVDINFNPNINSPPGSRNSMPSRDDINKNPRSPNTTRGPNTTSPGYGIFSRDA
jgi:translation initiation factor IF-3